MKTLSRCAKALTISILAAGSLSAAVAAANSPAPLPQPAVAKVVHHGSELHRKWHAASLNNEGAWLLKDGKFEDAIAHFEDALRADPGYGHAIQNLCIAYNNMGLQCEEPRQAVTCFHRALFVNPENRTVAQNLDCALAVLGFKPDSFDDCLKMAQECEKSGEHEGAVVEYQRALRLHDDNSVKEKLASALASVDFAGDVGRWFAHHNSFAGHPAIVVQLAFPAGNNYMQAVAEQMRKVWSPPPGTEAKRAVVAFNIHADGSVTDARIVKPSGVAAFDSAAVDACTRAAPFPRLPEGLPEPANIEFAFDLKVMKSHHQGGTLTAEQARERLAKARSDTASGAYVDAIHRLRHAYSLDRSGVHEQLVATAEAVYSKLPADSAVELLHAIMAVEPSDGVRSLLNKALHKTGVDPHSEAARFELAENARRAGNIDTAIVEYQEALRLGPNAAAEAKLAELTNLKRGMALVDQWQEALKDSETAENHAGLGHAYELCGDYERAAEQYKLAVALDPHLTSASDRLTAIAPVVAHP